MCRSVPAERLFYYVSSLFRAFCSALFFGCRRAGGRWPLPRIPVPALHCLSSLQTGRCVPSCNTTQSHSPGGISFLQYQHFTAIILSAFSFVPVIFVPGQPARRSSGAAAWPPAAASACSYSYMPLVQTIGKHGNAPSRLPYCTSSNIHSYDSQRRKQGSTWAFGPASRLHQFVEPLQQLFRCALIFFPFGFVFHRCHQYKNFIKGFLNDAQL